MTGYSGGDSRRVRHLRERETLVKFYQKKSRFRTLDTDQERDTLNVQSREKVRMPIFQAVKLKMERIGNEAIS